MKKLLLLFITGLSAIWSYGQLKDFAIYFDNTQYLEYLIIDTVQYPGNIWQVGEPQKPDFGMAFSAPNAIVTDTINPYPTNNTSVFILMDFVEYGFYYGLKMMGGFYNVQSDSLQDYGTIEISPDMGEIWIDIVNDTTYPGHIQWYVKPVLTGNSFGWKYFDVIFSDFASLFDLQFGDTVLYRFTFTSDNTYEELGGLMFDNIYVNEFVEGISETRFKSIKSVIYPNPSADHFTIKFENPEAAMFELSIYNQQSQMVFTKENISGTSVVVKSIMLEPGLYFYKLTNHNQKERAWGKFVMAQ